MATETFFRSEEIGRGWVKLLAIRYSRCRLLLGRCKYEHLFVPVGSMHCLAVVDAGEIIFAEPVVSLLAF